MKRIVVVGGGQASGQLLMSLRKDGFEGELVLVSAEDHPPYQRPPLSKLYLAGKIPAERLHFPPDPMLARLGVELVTGVRAMGLDCDTHTLGLDNGQTLSYDRLALATGASPIRLTVPGCELAGIRYLRTLEDADGIRQAARTGRSALIVGAGYIGLEVAATLRQTGLEVTVVERADQLMPRVAAGPIAEFYAAVHRARGVRVVTGTEVVELIGDGQVRGVRTDDDRELEADIVVIGIGIRPNVEPARAAGLPCSDGVDVDEHARTLDPDIVAAGDCTNHPNALLGRRLRLESVHNALEQGKSAAASLLDRDVPYCQMPWFWSDQFEFKWQAVGFSAVADDYLIDGDVHAGEFTAFAFQADHLIAVDTVNRIPVHMAARTLLNSSREVTRSDLEACGFDIERLLEDS